MTQSWCLPVVTLLVFIGVALFYFGVRPQWNHLTAFACVIAAVLFTLLPGKAK